MRCRECEYDLAGLSERVCPECSAPFNPDNAETYVTEVELRRTRPLSWPIVLLAAAPWSTVVLVHITPMVYAIEFGRLPLGTSGDDPGVMSLRGVLYVVTVILSWATVLGLPVGFVGVGFVLSESFRRGALTFAVFLVLWLAGVWVLGTDPFGTVAWWMG